MYVYVPKLGIFVSVTGSVFLSPLKLQMSPRYLTFGKFSALFRRAKSVRYAHVTVKYTSAI